MLVGLIGAFLVSEGSDTLAEDVLSGAAINRKRRMTRVRAPEVAIIFM